MPLQIGRQEIHPATPAACCSCLKSCMYPHIHIPEARAEQGTAATHMRVVRFADRAVTTPSRPATHVRAQPSDLEACILRHIGAFDDTTTTTVTEDRSARPCGRGDDLLLEGSTLIWQHVSRQSYSFSANAVAVFSLPQQTDLAYLKPTC